MTVSFKNFKLKFSNGSRKRFFLKQAILNLFLFKSNNDAVRVGLEIDDLTIKNGERVGVLGRNGAGKSTFLKCISGIYSSNTGELRVDGLVVPLIEIGSGFHPELTGYDNIILNLGIAGISNKLNSIIKEIIEFSELGEKIHTPVKYYSTGMNLRLGFAIVAQLEPDILIIDEFLAGGDISFVEKSRSKIIKMIESSRILIMVSHEIDYIKEYCDRVIVLKDGVIIFDGDVNSGIDAYLCSL